MTLEDSRDGRPTHRTDGARTSAGGPPCERGDPGELLSLDTFHVGKLKGVGKMWQVTGCDAASSFGWVRLIVGEVTAAAVLGFLRKVVRPRYQQAGWRLRRGLTDNGKEFKGVFVAGCERLRMRVTRIAIRHAGSETFAR